MAITPPRVAQVDPLFSAKQAAEIYGKDITPAQVISTLATIEGIHKSLRGFADKRGPVAAKHYHQGHEAASRRAVAIILDSLLAKGQPFEDLLERWSRSGAQDQVLYTLRHLLKAWEEGVWGEWPSVSAVVCGDTHQAIYGFTGEEVEEAPVKKTTHFHVKDSEALTVLIRFADSQGSEVLQITPVNDYFAATFKGVIEVTSETDLRPFKTDLDQRRTYWSEIVEVQEEALQFVGIHLERAEEKEAFQEEAKKGNWKPGQTVDERV